MTAPQIIRTCQLGVIGHPAPCEGKGPGGCPRGAAYRAGSHNQHAEVIR